MYRIETLRVVAKNTQRIITTLNNKIIRKEEKVIKII